MKINIIQKRILWVLLPALLFFLAWPPRDLFFLSFVAFVPLFYLEKHTLGKTFGWLVYLSLLLFNIPNTWWVWYASPAGSVFMLLANSALMALPWLLYRGARKQFGDGKALMCFIFFWLSFEYLHLNWDITWPWLTLGNVFAKYPATIQWYEYTGTLGGSLWVLMANVLAYSWWQSKTRKNLIYFSMLIAVPFLTSIFIWNKPLPEPSDTTEVLVIQPNIDPYQKFDPAFTTISLYKMLRLMDENITPNTSLVIMPETALVEYMDEDNFSQFNTTEVLDSFLQAHPQTKIISGASTYNFYDTNEKKAATARKSSNGDYYESYNTALLLDTYGVQSVYHKSRLVPGVEKMPYPKLLGFLELLSIDLGGVSGSLGSDNGAKVFKVNDKNIYAPLICYESVFPEYASTFSQKDATANLVITNDGWWGNTDGHRQHLYYASLRGIENRRELARSANTGTSAYIDAKGKIHKRTEWWVEDAFLVNLKHYTTKTFFTTYGDFIGRISSFIGVLFMLGIFVKKRTKLLQS